MRVSSLKRKTNETDINCEINLDGTGEYNIDTGIGFLNHMLETLSKHSQIDIKLNCKGDLNVDDHHTVEDCALILGKCFLEALQDNINLLKRFSDSTVALDESLTRVVLDISARPYCNCNLHFTREKIGDVSTEMISHFFITFAMNAKITLHIDSIKGINNHHISESAFKAFAICIRNAIKIKKNSNSTKGMIDV
jgi:imidazoleglycerol-phosphate dehydratase